MTRNGFKAIGVLLFLVWISTMAYLWSPDMFPKIWGSQKKSAKTDQAGNTNFSRSSAQRIRFPHNLDPRETVHVCITSDKNTIGGMVTLINSIHRNSKHPLMFHLTVDQDSGEHISKWLEVGELRDVMYEVKVFQREWVQGKITLNYARYYIPRLFPNLTGRVVFVDDDCIVQGDIYDLYNMKLKPDHMIAFSDDCSGAAKRMTGMKNNYADFIDLKNEHVKQMKFDPNKCSFNSGLFVADLDLWRKTTLPKNWSTGLNSIPSTEEVYGNERGGGGSQPPMMLVFYQNYTKIEPDWHVRYLGWTAGSRYNKEFINKAKLPLHWNGDSNPGAGSRSTTTSGTAIFHQGPHHEVLPVRRNNDKKAKSESSTDLVTFRSSYRVQYYWTLL
ncbi:hypothetical protein ScPMuIL_008589 [Solemya velum]